MCIIIRRTTMEDKQKAELIRGMFSNCTFSNSVVAGIAESGSEVFYEKSNGQTKAATVEPAAREAIMEYVKRLMPLVKVDCQAHYEQIWTGILDVNEVKQQVYNKGKQQDTLFNRNLVAQIAHQLGSRVYVTEAKPVVMAEYLEPGKGKDHPVRQKLGEMPERVIKKAIEDAIKDTI